MFSLYVSKSSKGETPPLVFRILGYHLGDHDTWAKMTNFEAAVRVPLIIKCPWKTAAAGKITGVLAEAVDLYPTLAALAGLPTPLSQVISPRTLSLFHIEKTSVHRKGV